MARLPPLQNEKPFLASSTNLQGSLVYRCISQPLVIIHMKPHVPKRERPRLFEKSGMTSEITLCFRRCIISSLLS